MYNKDKKQFGDPAASGKKFSEIRDLQTWQVVLQDHAKHVAESLKRKAPWYCGAAEIVNLHVDLFRAVFGAVQN